MVKYFLSIFILIGLISNTIVPSPKRRKISSSQSPGVGSEFHTPNVPARVSRLFQSPYYRAAEQQDPDNFCKQITQALNEDNLDAVKRHLINFFRIIPYTVNMDSSPFCERFYIALFTSLFSSLYGQNPRDITNYIIQDPSNNIVVTSVETSEAIYVLQYHIGLDAIDPVFTYEINSNDSEKPIRIIAFEHTPDGTGHFKFEIFEVENNGPTPYQVTPRSINYNEANFYKQMLACFTGNQVGLDSFLSNIYTSIPADLHIPREKFYQSIFYYLVKFFGNSNLNAELVVRRGRTDVVIETNRINIIEFKFDKESHQDITLSKRALEAIEQVKNKGYFDKFLGIGLQKWIFGVSINLDPERNQLAVTVDAERFYDPVIPRFGFRGKTRPRQLFTGDASSATEE